jgi:hypothetical protein
MINFDLEKHLKTNWFNTDDTFSLIKELSNNQKLLKMKNFIILKILKNNYNLQDMIKMKFLYHMKMTI